MKPAPPEVPAWAVKAEARISDNYNCDPVADTARSYLDTHDIARLIWEEYQEHAREACPPPAAARDGVVKAYEDYIAYLKDAEKMTIGFLHAHNWKYPAEFLERGNQLRDAIDAARKGTP